MKDRSTRVIVLGGSAGGLEAVLRIVSTLEADLPAAVFIVLHLGAGPAPGLEIRLAKAGPLPAAFARNGEPIEAGRLYIAPPDHHTLLKPNIIRLTHGPKVNWARPAIDLTFRSAAVAYGPQTIGVIVSGMLDDGTTGLHAIKRWGGVAIVQDPADALHAEMPASALSYGGPIDHTLPAATIGGLLNELVRAPVSSAVDIPADIRLENKFDMKSIDDPVRLDQLGSRVPLVCPECGGVLWEMHEKSPLRYRCHTGHSFTIHTLLRGQREDIEQSLWVALRTLEEKARTQEKLARWEEEAGRKGLDRTFQQRYTKTRTHTERLRQLLFEIDTANPASFARSDPPEEEKAPGDLG